MITAYLLTHPLTIALIIGLTLCMWSVLSLSAAAHRSIPDPPGGWRRVRIPDAAFPSLGRDEL